MLAVLLAIAAAVPALASSPADARLLQASQFVPLRCADGFATSAQTGACVPVLAALECPKGSVFSAEAARCVPLLRPLECAPGFVRDAAPNSPSRGFCVPIVARLSCALGAAFSSTAGSCVAPPPPPPAPAPSSSPTPTPSSTPSATRSAGPSPAASSGASPAASSGASPAASSGASPAATSGASPAASSPSSTASTTSKASASRTGTPSASVSPSLGASASSSVAASRAPSVAVISASLLFRPPTGSSGALDPAALADAGFQAAVAKSIAASLGIADASAVQVTGVQPVFSTEISARRRRRLQAAAAIVGYRVLISIRSSAAAASPALAAAVASGASLSGAVSSAVSAAVSGGSLVQAIAAENPASVAALGYSSTAAMVAGTAVDPTRPVALVSAAAPAVSASASESAGLSGGGTAGIIIAFLLLAGAGAYFAHSRGLIPCLRPPGAAEALKTPPVTPGPGGFQNVNPMKAGEERKGLSSASTPSAEGGGRSPAVSNPVLGLAGRAQFAPSSAV